MGAGVASDVACTPVWVYAGMDSTPVLVEGAGGDAGPSGCCPGVVAGAALGQRLSWEGGTLLSCLLLLLVEEEEWA